MSEILRLQCSIIPSLGKKQKLSVTVNKNYRIYTQTSTEL